MAGVLGVLECGVPVAELVDAAVDGAAPSAHSADCPHCQAATGTLARRWDAVREDAAQALSAPLGLAARALRHWRSQAGLQPEWMVLQPAAGGLRIASHAVATLAELAARRAAPLGCRGAACTGDRLIVDIAAPYGPPCHLAAEQVRQAVIDALAAALGQVTIPVDVRVVDVIAPASIEPAGKATETFREKPHLTG